MTMRLARRARRRGVSFGGASGAKLGARARASRCTTCREERWRMRFEVPREDASSHYRPRGLFSPTTSARARLLLRLGASRLLRRNDRNDDRRFLLPRPPEYRPPGARRPLVRVSPSAGHAHARAPRAHRPRHRAVGGLAEALPHAARSACLYAREQFARAADRGRPPRAPRYARACGSASPRRSRRAWGRYAMLGIVMTTPGSCEAAITSAGRGHRHAACGASAWRVAAVALAAPARRARAD